MAVEDFLRRHGEEKFKEALRLQDDEAKNDPETEPYKSFYKAREIFHDLKRDVDKQRGDNSDGVFNFMVMSAVLHLKLGINYVGSEEPSTGEEHLNKCLELLAEHRLDEKCCVTLMSALNELGILWATRRNPEKALGYLEKSEKLYIGYKHDVGNSPEMPEEHFEVKQQDQDEGQLVQKRKEHFEDKHTHTLYYLAQVYGKLEENQKSAEYCHETLRRQLDTRKYEPVDWALNAATLSQFYISHNNFPQARHCLASASYVLQELGDVPQTLTVTPDDDESQEELNKRERLPKAWADIYRCWIKYGLMLLEYSQARLYEQLDKQYSDEQNLDENKVVEDTEDEKNESIFKFNLELTAIESEITDKSVTEFEQAREVFLTVQKWVKSAKEFYVLDGYCTDYVEVVQDHSKLYKLLAGFEHDLDRQSKMHKRRVDMLVDILKQLNMQHYLLISRQLIYELAETYSHMLDIKLAIIEENGMPPSSRAVNKINQLATLSLDQYQAYLDTLKDTNKQLPSKYSEEDERPAMVAHFCMGRLHSKYIESDPAVQIRNVKRSLDCYQYVVDYCKRNPESEPKVKSEKEICEEMVLLLPSKMDRIRAQSQCVY
ncbi:hypothetical protein LSH36_162g01012 [Paralvinella palmiformis]|uniref:KIF-binding protein n=1 Tax=Paralvinella palmiformis TaxID=53620 RepID=A0AAD9N9B5_9ANNE|nr:hypothetical protein LSH36_162g01012 [Paralvinella palmiformis]